MTLSRRRRRRLCRCGAFLPDYWNSTPEQRTRCGDGGGDAPHPEDPVRTGGRRDRVGWGRGSARPVAVPRPARSSAAAAAATSRRALRHACFPCHTPTVVIVVRTCAAAPRTRNAPVGSETRVHSSVRRGVHTRCSRYPFGGRVTVRRRRRPRARFRRSRAP